MDRNTSFGVASTSRLTKLNRTPRTPASSIASNSASVMSGPTEAIPRARSPAARQASTMARLSRLWQVACTITLRSKPR